MGMSRDERDNDRSTCAHMCLTQPEASLSNVLKDLARFMVDAWTITLSFRAHVGGRGAFVSLQHVQETIQLVQCCE